MLRPFLARKTMADVPFNKALSPTQEEIDTAREEMHPQAFREWFKERLAVQDRVVFGHDHRRDKKGNPIEQGIGAPGHETENHFRAIGKYEGPEAEKAARAAAAARKGGRKPAQAEA